MPATIVQIRSVKPTPKKKEGVGTGPTKLLLPSFGFVSLPRTKKKKGVGFGAPLSCCFHCIAFFSVSHAFPLHPTAQVGLSQFGVLHALWNPQSVPQPFWHRCKAILAARLLGFLFCQAGVVFMLDPWMHALMPPGCLAAPIGSRPIPMPTGSPSVYPGQIQKKKKRLATKRSRKPTIILLLNLKKHH